MLAQDVSNRPVVPGLSVAAGHTRAIEQVCDGPRGVFAYMLEKKDTLQRSFFTQLLAVGVSSFAPFAARFLPLAGPAQFKNKHGFFVLSYGTENLSHQNAAWVIRAEIGLAGGEQRVAGFLHVRNDGFLHHQIARQPVQFFDDDSFYSVPLKSIEEIGERRPVFQLARAAHAALLEDSDDMQVMACAEFADGDELPSKPVTADLASSAHAKIGINVSHGETSSR